MEKITLLKNRLDLEYHGEAQKANAFLVLLTTGILGFVGTFVWQASDVWFYFGIMTATIFFLVGLYLYIRSVKRMKEILDEVGCLHED